MAIGERIRFFRNLRGMTHGYGKVPSQQLSDAMVEAFKDRLINNSRNDKKPVPMRTHRYGLKI